MHRHGRCGEGREDERREAWLARRAARRGFFEGGGRDHEGGFGGGFLRPGRMMGQEQLRLAILALLDEKPRHGYEIIKAIEEHAGGHYSPSPGMVYPTLTYLEDMGYTTVEAEGAKKLYAITEEGRSFLRQNRQAADAVLARLTLLGETIGRMRERFAPRGHSEYGEDLSSEVSQALRRLTATLAGRSDATGEEQDRIIAILNEAIERIRKS